MTGSPLWRTSLVGIPVAIKTADLDGDGHDEILVSTHGLSIDRWVLYLLDAETGKVRANVQSIDGFARSIAVADVDGDGVQDVALAVMGNRTVTGPRLSNFTSDRVEVIAGGPLMSGAFALPVGLPATVLWRAALTCRPEYICWPRHFDSMQMGDLNGDGVPDVAVLNDWGRLDAFDVRDGTRLWFIATGYFEDSGIAIWNGNVYVPTGGGMRALRGTDGEILWENSSATYATSTALVGSVGGRSVVFTGDIISTPSVREAHVAAYDAQSGAQLWRYAPTGAPLNYEPHDIALADVHASPGPELVVSMSKSCCGKAGWTLYNDPGVILVLDAETGALLEELLVPISSFRVGAGARDGGPNPEVFAASYSGGVRAFNVG